jgi:hypothetical protein
MRPTVLAAAVIVSTWACPAFSQAKPPDLSGGGTALESLANPRSGATGAAPRTADGKPNLAGLWGPDRNFIYDISSALRPGETLPLQPWAAKMARERMSKDDPEANCLPAGVPRMAPYPWKIVQTPELIVFLYEGNIHTYRQVFLNRSTHSKDADPTWYGDSIGKWDGDTLVVDTVGFNDKFWFDFAGHPHTEKLHVTERYRRPILGNLDFEIVIDDPGAYTKPFTLVGRSPLLTNTEIMEYICNENNVDVSHILGKDDRK